MLILSSIFWFVLAFVIAALEVEAEGKYGWAERMPTWYRTRGLVGRTYGVLMGGKPLTGYHTFTFFFPLLLLHCPFVSGVSWSLSAELMVLSLYFAWTVLWDYLWFVLNPNYTWRGFRKDRVWWHAQSPWLFGVMPLDYLIGWGLAVALAFAASLAPGATQSLFTDRMIMLGLFLVGTALTIALSPLYHAWHAYMRRRDDREETPIFHRD